MRHGTALLAQSGSAEGVPQRGAPASRREAPAAGSRADMEQTNMEPPRITQRG